MHLFDSISSLCRFHLGLWVPVVISVLAFAVGACDSTSDEPATGTLAVTVTTSGESPDADGYTITVDDMSSDDVGPAGSVTFADVVEGPQQIQLSGLEPNCEVDGSNPRSTPVFPGDTTSVSFEVICRRTTGAMDVVVGSTGQTLDEDGYILSIDGNDSTHVGTNGRATFRGLSEGNHEILLSDRQVNCSVEGENPRTVNVEATQTATVSMNLTCEHALFGVIVFGSDRSGPFNIYAMDVQGRNVRQITADGGGQPSVSPDGTHIAFSSSRTGNLEIFTIQPDGSDLTQVTSNSAIDTQPTWSPDGDRLAFLSTRDGNYDVYTIKPDGTDPIRITHPDENDGQPTWSPDGTRIAFARSHGGAMEIYTVRPDGSDLTRVTESERSEEFPAWSPTGDRIALHQPREEGGTNTEIYTIRVDGSDTRRVTDDSGVDEFPAWSPDGSRIAFQTDRSGTSNIYTINPDGTDPAALTDNSFADRNPTWAPSK